MIYISAISMPIDLYHCNQLIVKRITYRLNLNENKGRDTSCYEETKIGYLLSMSRTTIKSWIRKWILLACRDGASSKVWWRRRESNPRPRL